MADDVAVRCADVASDVDESSIDMWHLLGKW
jgi:hypothetical protein